MDNSTANAIITGIMRDDPCITLFSSAALHSLPSSCTRRIWLTAQSSNRATARSNKIEPVYRLPASTFTFLFTCTGSLLPVKTVSSTVPSPRSTIPSIGTRSPERTSTKSPTRISAGVTCRSSPCILTSEARSGIKPVCCVRDLCVELSTKSLTILPTPCSISTTLASARFPNRNAPRDAMVISRYSSKYFPCVK